MNKAKLPRGKYQHSNHKETDHSRYKELKNSSSIYAHYSRIHTVSAITRTLITLFKKKNEEEREWKMKNYRKFKIHID